MVTSLGTTHYVMGTTDDGSGGTHLDFKADSKGTGVGLPPAMLVYRVGEQFTESVQNPDGDQFTWTEVERHLILGPKSVDNYIRHMVFRLHQDANGVVTASFDRMFTKCVG